ncbi:MAG TPA: 30S ribosomal protein S2 [Candidatus Paceibacterota bacterium]|nr:30S ribosomal protein S2 [Candidatus Paceibacterota bacterium]
MEQITDNPLIPYDDMLKAGMHFGRKRTVFSPRMDSCVFTVRDGICIIDLLKTQERLAGAIGFLKGTLSAGGLVLFVAPTKQSQESVRALAEALGMPYVTDRWIGGTLTNFKAINGRVKRLIEMEEARSTGGWDKYTKKERVVLEKELAKMRTNFEGLKKLTRMPDVVFVASLREGAIAVHEARKMGVKIAAIGNTDANPEGVEHVICANDRSKKSVDLLVNAIRKELTGGSAA